MGLPAQLVNRMVLGTMVFDHERTGARELPFEVVVVYNVVNGLIQCTWSFVADSLNK